MTNIFWWWSCSQWLKIMIIMAALIFRIIEHWFWRMTRMLVALEGFKNQLDGRSCIVPYLNWWENTHYELKSWSHEPHPWHNGHHHSSARFSSTTLTQPHPLLTGNRSDGGPDPPTSVHRGQTRRLLQWQPVTSRWWHAQVEPSNYNKGMEEHQQWSWCLEACQEVCHWPDHRQDRSSFFVLGVCVGLCMADTVLKWPCNALITERLDLYGSLVQACGLVIGP